MVEYRIDTTATATQRAVLYLHGVASVSNNADITMFLANDGHILAVVPVSANVAYVAV